MIILSIETSCDETAVALIEAAGGTDAPNFRILGTGLYSQIALHTQYGGVYPNLAKREHARNIVPLLEACLTKAGVLKKETSEIGNQESAKIQEILSREGNLGTELITFLERYKQPAIDAIAVTQGPGLEPALWVGVNFALALGHAWDIPVIGTNHMKGHIASVLMQSETKIQESGVRIQNETTGNVLVTPSVSFPALALLISGGHTELVLVSDWNTYEVIGKTRDDAVGEAFDKVARMLGLPYPGGPEISGLAAEARKENLARTISLPRPMIHSKDLDFSFSGLKTAVLYTIKDILERDGQLSETMKKDIAREFEDAATEVLLAKISQALTETGAQTVIVSGGVSANSHIRESVAEVLHEKYPSVQLHIPPRELATDNAVMIAMAAYLEVSSSSLEKLATADIHAKGNLAY